jgi:hypothetical protein
VAVHAVSIVHRGVQQHAEVGSAVCNRIARAVCDSLLWRCCANIGLQIDQCGLYMCSADIAAAAQSWIVCCCLLTYLLLI